MFGKTMLCLDCEHQGEAKKVTKGSFIVELLAWFLMILPGILYTLWRLSTKYKACSKCGSARIVPLDSPVAKRVLTVQIKGCI